MASTWTPYADGAKPLDSPAADLADQTFEARCKECLRARQAAGFFGFRKRADGTCDIPDTCLPCRGLLALYERCFRGDLGIEGPRRRLMRIDTGEIVHEDYGLK
ncbi:hypothetical protein MN608_11489 [Microdochium nivale]|nr:hypothetical protein MN608_11489 [Microdochium nivale]